MLTDADKKKISDVASGKNINFSISPEDQFAAIRKQIDLILAANPKIPIDADYKKFSEIVGAEKDKKKDTKAASV